MQQKGKERKECNPGIGKSTQKSNKGLESKKAPCEWSPEQGEQECHMETWRKKYNVKGIRKRDPIRNSRKNKTKQQKKLCKKGIVITLWRL